MKLYRIDLDGASARYFYGDPIVGPTGALICQDSETSRERRVVFGPNHWQSFEEADEGLVVQTVADNIAGSERRGRGFHPRATGCYPERVLDLAAEMAKDILAVDAEEGL